MGKYADWEEPWSLLPLGYKDAAHWAQILIVLEDWRVTTGETPEN